MHPVAFTIGSFTVYWYGIMMALAFLVGLWTASRRGLRDGIEPEKILDLGLWLIVGTIVGARIVHVVTYWKEIYADKPFTEVFMLRHGGLVFYGGLIGASLACLIYTLLKKMPVWKTADALAPSVALGYVFGRIGCLLYGCCYGRACGDHWWAIRYPAPHEMHPTGQDAIPVYPTQIFDSLLNLGLYLGLAWLYRRKKFHGQVFATYLMCYAVTRSIVETFRGDYTAPHLHGGLTPAHLISIGILFAGIAIFFVRRHLQSKAQ